jgi:hypothetical protein
VLWVDTDDPGDAVVPAGGLEGQILAKTTDSDYDTGWIDNFAQQIEFLAKNDTGGSVTKGQAVYVSGGDGTNILFELALATSDATSAQTVGLLVQDLAVNGQGYIINQGLLTNVDTSAAGAVGDPVYLSGTTPGGLVFGVANKPVAPVHLVYLGVVTRKSATVGEIFVQVQNGYELQELHNVAINNGTLANGDALVYDSTTQLWKNTQPNALPAILMLGGM